MSKVISPEAAQAVMDKRGYIIIATRATYSVGTVLAKANWSAEREGLEERDYPLVVIGITDRNDFIEQARMLGIIPWLSDELPNYYRVIAE